MFGGLMGGMQIPASAMNAPLPQQMVAQQQPQQPMPQRPMMGGGFNNRFLQGNFNGGLLGGMPQGQGMPGLLGNFSPMQRPQMGMMGGMGGMFQRQPYMPQRFPAPPMQAPPMQQQQQAPQMPAQQGGFSPYHDIPPDLYNNLMFIQSRGGE